MCKQMKLKKYDEINEYKWPFFFLIAFAIIMGADFGRLSNYIINNYNLCTSVVLSKSKISFDIFLSAPFQIFPFIITVLIFLSALRTKNLILIAAYFLMPIDFLIRPIVMALPCYMNLYYAHLIITIIIIVLLTKYVLDKIRSYREAFMEVKKADNTSSSDTHKSTRL